MPVRRSSSPDLPRAGMRLFWLAYVLFVFIGPLVTGGRPSEWALAAGSILLFLPLYFSAWRAVDRGREHQALLFAVGFAVLGLVLIPWNMGANTYVVYSAAFVPFLLSPRATIAYFVSLVAAVALVALLLPAPAWLWTVMTTTMLIVMIGGGSLFHAERQRHGALLWRAHEEVEQMAVVAERERISRDLHDLLGHTLSVIALKSELASRLVDDNPVRARDEIREIEHVSREALAEVRAAVEGYRGRGFPGELRNAARALDASGVRLDAEVADVRMPPRQESVMALVLREAVTNIVRHARATTCRVSLEANDRELVLTVRDDGVGGMPREGYGLSGMRERVTAAGGTFSSDGANGWTVTARLPRVTGPERVAS